MKAGTVVKLALALLVAAGVTYAVKPELLRDYLPGGLTQQLDELMGNTEKKGKKSKKGGKKITISNIGIVKGAEWVDCAKVRDKVAAEITKKLSSATETSVADFIKSPENRLLLAQWVIADAELRTLEEVQKNAENHRTELEKAQKALADKKALIPAGTEAPAALAWDIANLEKKVARLESAIKSDCTFSESAAGKGGAKLMELIGGDPDWAWQFAFSGECVRPGMALSILKKISKDNPDMVTNRMVRDIATATALEYAKSNWNQQDAVERANFYIESWKDERLNTVFDTLPMWQRRMVCGCKGDNPYGSISSLRWAQDNMRLPADRYSGSCWRCAYRLNNIYGDSIHGPLYYAPFEGALGDNREAMTYYVGGVCGSLSHFGAFAALANGVPAMTAGEPGHCAFIVLVGDTWTPAYSLSWQRGLHWQVFRSVHSYSSLHSASELYSDEQKPQTDLSNALRVLAGVKAAAGDLAAATAAFEQSVKAQPRNWMVWREWMEALNNGSATAADWEKLNDALCTNLVPIYPEMGFELMQKGLVDSLAGALGSTPERLRSAYLKFWQNIKTMGPDRWHIEPLADKQLAAMGIDSKKPEELCSYYGEVLSLLVSDEKYGPAILSWGNSLSSKLDKKDQGRMTQAMISSISKNSDLTNEDRIKMLAPAMLAAEKSRDRSSFQAIGKMIADLGHKNPDIKMPANIEPFPGKLASEGGMLWTSSTSQWDKPHDHAGILTPQGGSFHTAKDTDAYVAVELPRQVNVTGIVIVTVPGSAARHNNMKIQVSENGEDWVDVHQFGPCNQRIMRSDLGGKLPLAKYVRIVRTGGPDFFHLNGIYIYGNQAA